MQNRIAFLLRCRVKRRSTAFNRFFVDQSSDADEKRISREQVSHRMAQTSPPACGAPHNPDSESGDIDGNRSRVGKNVWVHGALVYTAKFRYCQVETQARPCSILMAASMKTPSSALGVTGLLLVASPPGSQEDQTANRERSHGGPWERVLGFVQRCSSRLCPRPSARNDQFFPVAFPNSSR